MMSIRIDCRSLTVTESQCQSDAMRIGGSWTLLNLSQLRVRAIYSAGLYIAIPNGYIDRRNNVRWWSVAHVSAADEQGTPVQFRDGPAAVTEQVPRSIL
jgi:hypothetical protein